MKVAFATQDLETVNAHFGWAKTIVGAKLKGQIPKKVSGFFLCRIAAAHRPRSPCRCLPSRTEPVFRTFQHSYSSTKSTDFSP